MKKIFIVTVNFNAEEATHNLLFSLKGIKTSDFSISILVVDNASKNPFMLSTDEKKNNIHLITNTENLGFTGGYNSGIDFSLSQNADYILLINNDTTVDKNFLIELLKGFQANNEIGATVPKIYFSKGHEYHKGRYKKNELGKVIWYAGGEIDWANILVNNRDLDEVDNGQFNKNEETEFATGCCILLKTEVIKKIGKFDKRYFLYLEDADLSLRIIRNGFKILYCPKALIWHINAGSTDGAGSPLHDYYLTRNRMLFGFEYGSIRAKFALIRESLRLLLSGSKWQKIGIVDFYLRRLGKGSFGI